MVKRLIGISTRFSETKKLYQYGYNNYSVKDLLSANDVVTQIKVKNATKDTKDLDLQANSSLPALLSNDMKIDKLEKNIQLNSNIKAPIEANEVLGYISYTIDGIEYTTDLTATHPVKKSKFWNYIIYIGIGILFIFLIQQVFYAKRKKKVRHYR